MRIFGTQKASPWPAGPCSLALLGLGLSLHEIVSKRSLEKSSLKKQRTFRDAINGFPTRMKSEKRVQKITYWWRVNNQIWVVLPVGQAVCTTQIWLVMCYQYRISALVSQMSFRVETSGGIAKCWLFSQAGRNSDAYIISLSAYKLYMHFQMHSIILFKWPWNCILNVKCILFHVHGYSHFFWLTTCMRKWKIRDLVGNTLLLLGRFSNDNATLNKNNKCLFLNLQLCNWSW